MEVNTMQQRPVDRILVVDDDPLFRVLVSASLERAGCHVATAGDGVEGLECLDREPYDLALIDLSMPRVDGFRLIALIRGSRRHRQLVILVASARLDTEAYREALRLGADAATTKPLDFSKLVDQVRALIDEARSRTSKPG